MRVGNDMCFSLSDHASVACPNSIFKSLSMHDLNFTIVRYLILGLGVADLLVGHLLSDIYIHC